MIGCVRKQPIDVLILSLRMNSSFITSRPVHGGKNTMQFDFVFLKMPGLKNSDSDIFIIL